MSLQTIRRLAARVTKAGQTRIRIMDEEQAGKAITADDVRNLLKEGAVIVLPAKFPGRSASKVTHARKREGRRRGPGSQRGSYYAGVSKKERWMAQVRSQRQYLAAVKTRLKEGKYPAVYKMIKGNAFRSKKNLKAYLDSSQSWA